MNLLCTISKVSLLSFCDEALRTTNCNLFYVARLRMLPTKQAAIHFDSLAEAVGRGIEFGEHIKVLIHDIRLYSIIQMVISSAS